MMFFKKKNLINCTIKCINRETIYGVDNDGKNTSTNSYSFSIIEPKYLNYKILYQYHKKSNKFSIGSTYNGKYNTDTGELFISTIY